MAEITAENSIILALFPSLEDRLFLASVFDSGWRLRFVNGIEQARTALRAGSVGVVLSEAQADGGSWKDLLREIENLPDPPPLIVADRLADEILWAEVLNLGGYDLLMKPFSADEVLRVVTAAYRFHENEQGLIHKAAKAASAAAVPSGKRARAASDAV
jgi:DNA-binding response OmpR family regulator